MSQTCEKTFSIEQSPSKPALSHQEVTSFTVNIVLSRSTTHQDKQKSDTIISLGIPENESLDDANKDMDRLAQQFLEDIEE